MFVGVVADTFDSEMNLNAGSVEGGAGEIDCGGSGFAGGGKIALGECGGACKKDKLGAFESAFFYRLDDCGLAACFGQGAGDGFFIYQRKIPTSEAALFEQGLEFGAEQGRSAREHDTLGGASHGHDYAVREEATRWRR